MNMATKHGVLHDYLNEWLACTGDRQKRGALTKRLAPLLRLHEKSIGRSMRRLQMRSATKKERRGRPVIYGNDVVAAFAEVWDACGNPCAENMPSASMEVHIAALAQKKRWCHDSELTETVLGMSAGTKKKHIAALRTKRGMKRGYCATKSSPLKGMIPIRKSHTWEGLPPGHIQTDTVVHCGDLLSDDVVYSIGGVDYALYWAEYTAQWNKGEIVTRESLKVIRARFPFPWKELHPDSGNEFINYHVHRWACDEGIEMTRSEPYKKNDNMCIEERNNSIARKHLGYARLDDEAYVSIAAELLRVACLLHNHFRPVRRMMSKVRVGAKWKYTREKEAKTPYQRVLERKDISDAIKNKLRAEHDVLNPIDLVEQLARLQADLSRKLQAKRVPKSHYQSPKKRATR
jgi:hypothetical protein